MKNLKKKSVGYAGIEITDFVESRAYGYESERSCECACQCTCDCSTCDPSKWWLISLSPDLYYDAFNVDGTVDVGLSAVVNQQ